MWRHLHTASRGRRAASTQSVSRDDIVTIDPLGYNFSFRLRPSVGRVASRRVPAWAIVGCLAAAFSFSISLECNNFSRPFETNQQLALLACSRECSRSSDGRDGRTAGVRKSDMASAGRGWLCISHHLVTLSCKSSPEANAAVTPSFHINRFAIHAASCMW